MREIDMKTKPITRVIAAAVLFAFCANPICYAAYSYNVTEGANGEIIIGAPATTSSGSKYTTSKPSSGAKPISTKNYSNTTNSTVNRSYTNYSNSTSTQNKNSNSGSTKIISPYSGQTQGSSSGSSATNGAGTLYNSGSSVQIQPAAYAVSSGNTTLQGGVMQVGKGSTIKGFLQNSVSTVDSANGDPIVAVLSENWYENGKLIAEAGSVINGTISSVDAAGNWSKDGSLQISFDSIETPAGEKYAITAEKIDIQVEQEESKGKKAAKIIGGGILAVAAIFAIVSALTDKEDTETTTYTKNGKTTTTTTTTTQEHTGKDIGIAAAIGAGIGLLGGLVVLGCKKGDEITIPANTTFEIKLLDNIKAVSY